MTRLRALDPFCGQGGTSQGLIDAGFDVYGVDLADHSKRYPGAFHVGDVIDVLLRLLDGRSVPFAHKDGRVEYLYLEDFDLIFGGPPCQGYSIATAGNPAARAKYDRLIAIVRDLLEQTGLPWVIENVELARSEMRDPILLCGRMFDLRANDADGLPLVLDRHRLFESNRLIVPPPHPTHGDEQVAGVYGGSRRAPLRKGIPHDQAAPYDRFAARHIRGGGYVPRSKAVQQQLLGIDWMTLRGMQESIPPSYSHWIGAQLLAHINQEKAA